jgi:3-hydroxyacyl-[acyl-carrier-protein] dehydratase
MERYRSSNDLAGNASPASPSGRAGECPPATQRNVAKIGVANQPAFRQIPAAAMRFFLIDRITRWEVGSVAEACKNVALSEDFFDDHFPRRPVMPGVLILEGAAQLAGLLLEASRQQKYLKSAKAILSVLERTKFRAMVKPGDTLHFRVEIASLNEVGGKVRASASRGESPVCSTEMTFAFREVEDRVMDEKTRALLALWMRDDRSE